MITLKINKLLPLQSKDRIVTIFYYSSTLKKVCPSAEPPHSIVVKMDFSLFSQIKPELQVCGHGTTSQREVKCHTFCYFFAIRL